MAKKWIAKAIKKKGALKKTAKRQGLIKGNEKLSASDVSKLAKSKNPKTRQRANLAKTLAGLRK